MVIFWVLTVCGGVIRQYGNFYQNYNNFSKIVFSVYKFYCYYSYYFSVILFNLMYQVYSSCLIISNKLLRENQLQFKSYYGCTKEAYRRTSARSGAAVDDGGAAASADALCIPKGGKRERETRAIFLSFSRRLTPNYERDLSRSIGGNVHLRNDRTYTDGAKLARQYLVCI